MKENIEKSAMSDAEKMKYVKAAILSAVAASGIGAVVKDWKSKKARKRAAKTEDTKNAIVVPVKKTKFLEGLPTPEELASSRGEGVQSALSGDAASDKQLTMLADEPSASANVPSQMSAEEIAAKKRDILRGASRRVDFFGKAAEKKTKESVGGDEEGRKEYNNDGKHDSGKKKDEDERILFRDQSGRFVSPTDPIAVAQVEKSAEGWGWLWDTIAHPIDSAGMVLNAAKDKPVMFTAGAIGSVYLAAKISDIINKRRRERAKERLDDAREQYVEILQGDGSEKVAELEKSAVDPRNVAGTVLGASFFVPMAITALVTNRIIENRREEKKKQKEVQDSYPDDPIILYKTSDDHEIAMSPEAAVAAIAFKRGMIEASEYGVFAGGSTKSASVVGDLFNGARKGFDNYMDRTFTGYGNAVAFTPEEARDWAVGYLSNDDYDKYLNPIVGSFIGPNKNGESAKIHMFNMLKDLGKTDPGAARFLKAYEANGQAVMDSLLTSKKLEDTVAKRLSDSRWDDRYGPMRDYEVNSAISRYFGVEQGGWIHKILAWLANAFGFSRSMAGTRVSDVFAKYRNGYGNPPAAQTAAPAQTPAANPQGASSAIGRTGSNIRSWFLGGKAPKAPSVPGVTNKNVV